MSCGFWSVLHLWLPFAHLWVLPVLNVCSISLHVNTAMGSAASQWWRVWVCLAREPISLCSTWSLFLHHPSRKSSTGNNAVSGKIPLLLCNGATLWWLGSRQDGTYSVDCIGPCSICNSILLELLTPACGNKASFNASINTSHLCNASAQLPWAWPKYDMDHGAQQHCSAFPQWSSSARILFSICYLLNVSIMWFVLKHKTLPANAYLSKLI